MSSRLGVLTLVTPLALAALLPATTASAQAELTGTYIRYFAVGTNGSFISGTHSMQYTESGSSPYSCDAFYPGSPVEGFTVEATAGASTLIATNNASSTDLSTTSGPTILGRTITWRGSYTSGSASIAVDQVATFESSARSVSVRTTVRNTGSVSLTNVYYLRDADPDFGSCTIGTAYETANDVRRQPPAASSALVTSTAGSPAVVLGVGSRDPRARAHAGGFENTDASGIWSAPTDPAGALGDESIDVAFREASIPVGGSTTFEWFYVWGSTVTSVESRFDGLTGCTGEGTACAGGTCHGGSCCTGCWDGAACQSGASASACGRAGGACTSCSDGNVCTADLCSAGACDFTDTLDGSSCDDGLFCTELDACSGSVCRGATRTCDDGNACTSDRCDEALTRCVNVDDLCARDAGPTGSDAGPTGSDAGPTGSDAGPSGSDAGVVEGDATIPTRDGGADPRARGRSRGGCSAAPGRGPAPLAWSLGLLLALLARRRRC